MHSSIILKSIFYIPDFRMNSRHSYFMSSVNYQNIC